MNYTERNLKRELPKQTRALRNAAGMIAALLLLSCSLFAWEIVQQPSRLGEYGAFAFRNYGVVWPGKVFRSGKPYSDVGWRWLHDQGVRGIVSFVDQDDVDYHRFGFEAVLQIPLQDEELPSEEQTKQFLVFIQDPQVWPVDVHCAAGKDRTGMMIALARYAIDGWPMDEALAEARRYRHGKDLSRFRVTWLKQWEATHKPGSERRPAQNARGLDELH